MSKKTPEKIRRGESALDTIFNWVKSVVSAYPNVSVQNWESSWKNGYVGRRSIVHSVTALIFTLSRTKSFGGFTFPLIFQMKLID
jgi:hypothetical protein